MDKESGNLKEFGNFGRVVENVAMDAEANLTKIMKGLARRNRERHAMLAEMEEEYQDVVCVDDITGKEFPCHAVCKARAQELNILHDI